MRVVTGLALCLVAVAWVGVGPAGAAEVWVDSFESYTSDAELQAVWSAGTANVSVHLAYVGYDSPQSMRIAYNNGADPWWGRVVFAFDTPQDWTNFSRLTLRYMGEDGNSEEGLAVQIKNPDGEYLSGPTIPSATHAWEWLEYSLSFEGWAFLHEVKYIEIHLPAGTYGSGNLYIDRIVVDTFPPVVDDFETYANTTELRAAWQTNQIDYIWLAETGSSDGEPYHGSKYVRSDYLSSFPPYDAVMTLTFSKEQDWSAYKTLKLWYRGRDALINARQDFQVQLKDKFGGYFNGPIVENATQCVPDPTYCEWVEYVMGIEDWTERGFAQSITLQLLGFPDYGNGRFFVDLIELSENPPVSADPESWSGIKAMFR